MEGINESLLFINDLDAEVYAAYTCAPFLRVKDCYAASDDCYPSDPMIIRTINDWMIRDYGSVISTYANDENSSVMGQAIAAAEMAHFISVRKWARIQILDGTKTMKRFMWLEAQRYGFSIDYTPNKDDERWCKGLKNTESNWEKPFPDDRYRPNSSSKVFSIVKKHGVYIHDVDALAIIDVLGIDAYAVYTRAPFLRIINVNATVDGLGSNFTRTINGWIMCDYEDSIAVYAHNEKSSVMEQAVVVAETANLIKKKNWRSFEIVGGNKIMKNFMWAESKRRGFTIDNYIPSKDDTRCYERLVKCAKDKSLNWEKPKLESEQSEVGIAYATGC